MGEGVTYSLGSDFGGERWEARVSLRMARFWGFLEVTFRCWSAVDGWQSSLQLEEVAGPEKQEELLGFGEVILGGAGARPRRQGQRIQHRCYGRDELSWSGSVLPKRAAPARKGEPAAQRPWAGEGHEGEDVDLEKCRWGLAPDPPSPWGHSHNTHLTPVLVIREGGRCAWGRLPDSSCEPPVSRYTPRTPVRRAELL